MTDLTADRVLTETDGKRLLKILKNAKDAALVTGKNRAHVADYYLIAIVTNTGLRISEVAALKWSDVHADHLTVQRGKGGKRRTVFFGKATRALFDEFRAHCKTLDEFVFNGQRGPLTRTAIHRRFHYWKRRTGISDSVTFHSLRHGYATRMLDYGVPLTSVRDQLGHSNISITSVYLHFTQEAREKLSQLT